MADFSASGIAGLPSTTADTLARIEQGGGDPRVLGWCIEAVQEGDRIVTAGLGGVFPKGLPLGIVTQVRRDERSWSTSATVKPAAALGRLEEVLCLRSEGP